MDRVAHASRVRAGADRGNRTVRDRHGAVHPRVAKRRGVARLEHRGRQQLREYRLDIDGDILDAADEARLSFYALWQNRQDVDVTVRVASQLNVNAHVSAHADGRRFSSIFIPGASADASLRGRLTLTPLWLQNTQFTAAEGFVGSVSARGGFFGDDDAATIFTSVSLDGSLPVTVLREGS